MNFAVDYTSFIFIAGILLLGFTIGRLKSKIKPAVFYFTVPSYFGISRTSHSLKSQFARFTYYLLMATLSFWLLAFLDLHFTSPSQSQADQYPTEGVAIYLVLDQSGSMGQSAGEGQLRKIDMMKKLTSEFIQERPNDLIGLVTFARGAQVLAPLTLDRTALNEALNELDLVKERDQDGTSIGYAIFKAANLIAATRHFAEEVNVTGKKTYAIKNVVMILVTDGFQDPNPLDKGKRLRNMDVDEAAAYAQKQGIRLYIINVEPSLGSEEYAPHRHLMERSAELTGGQFFLVGKSQSLKDIYQEINQAEKSEVLSIQTQGQLPPKRIFSLYPLFIAFGLCTLLLSFVLKTTWLRKIP